MKLKQIAVIGAALMVVATVRGQIAENPDPAPIGEVVENRPFDGSAKATVYSAPDDAAKLAAIRALTPTTRIQSNWVAAMEATVLTDQGQEVQAVEAARRITEPEWAAMTELRVRFYSSNYSKAIEVGEPWLAKPQAEFSDVYRMRMADLTAQAMKASGGDVATKSNRVRVVREALSTIGHTTFTKHAVRTNVGVSGLVLSLVDVVQKEGVPDAEQQAMFRHLVRVTPVTKLTLKTVGKWKGWVEWHGGENVQLGDYIVGQQSVKLVDLHAADEVSRALERGAVTNEPASSDCVRVLTVALSNVDEKTLSRLGYAETSSVPRLVVRLVNFVRQAGTPDAEREAMLRHLAGLVPVTEHTFKTVGDWKGWLARHGHKDVVLNDVVEGTNTLELVDIYAGHSERNVPLPYRDSVFGEAYQRRDVPMMRRYLDSFTK
jgi:hypothetical protein